jgi:hypothetical protein
MTHVLPANKSEFSSIKEGYVPFKVIKANKPFKVGDTLIFHEVTGENDHATGEEHHTEITYLYQADGVKTGWVAIAFKSEE